jgi:RNA polymerase sigma-70 factor (ECF subfamily)
MTMDSSFALMMNRLRDGDEQAASEVFQKFLHRLIALASRQFESRLRVKADPEDVIQSVYLSFLKRIETSPYEIADWGWVWALLVTITIRKCHDRRRFWRAARRDYTAEVASVHDPEGNAWWEAIERGPTPLQAMVLAETLDELTAGHTASQRMIAELTFQGFSGVEIAKRCECSERIVYRVVKRMREQLTAMDAADNLI